MLDILSNMSAKNNNRNQKMDIVNIFIDGETPTKKVLKVIYV